jgi:hypothetical protein
MSNKLLFSHVWEDPSIEASVVGNNKKMLMICSGGDTLIHILCEDSLKIKNMKFDIIDSNKLQISLCVFKLLLLDYTKNNDNYWKLLYNTENYEIEHYNFIIDELIKIYEYLPYVKYLDLLKANSILLKKGILLQGELEKTFKNLVNSKMNFVNNFNHTVLCDKFGSNAVQLTSIDNDFVKRFKFIYDKYIEYYGTNIYLSKYYHRMMTGYEKNDIQNEIVDKFKINFDKDLLKNINFIYQDIETFVENSQIDTYDIIQLSNVTDWLKNNENIIELVKNVYKICKFEGNIIWRSLNGDYILSDMIEIYHKNNLKTIKYCEDKSFFYKTVIISTKCFNVETMLLNVEKLTENNMFDHPYFKKLQEFSLNEFYKTQLQFYHAVKHWVYILQKVSEKLKNINEFELDTILNKNINEELGKENGISHSETFIGFLKSLNNGICDDVNNIKYKSICVTKFNDTLERIINEQDLVYVCAFLGAIEYKYIRVSQFIKEYCDVHLIKQPHYTLHEILDIEHSTDLYYIATTLFTKYNNNLNNLYQGIKDGCNSLMNLYKEML